MSFDVKAVYCTKTSFGRPKYVEYLRPTVFNFMPNNIIL